MAINAQRPFLGPLVNIISINVESLSTIIEDILYEYCVRFECNVTSLQETHRGLIQRRPKINGMKTVIERPYEKYDCAIFMVGRWRQSGGPY